ncbi:MAG: hypothetical protein IT317_07535 [Anaerolineales bacterium]|nr:hypothetical protein [Anaerolineales bacterium]
MTDPASLEAARAAAVRVGVEFDAAHARQWLLAVSAADRAQGWAQDAQTGAFGSHIALADFDAADLDYFRRLAQRVRLERHPAVESAIAIAGSAAQGQIQLFPGDIDFFERVHLHAATEAAARDRLRELVRATALRAMAEPDLVLIEANLGVYPWPVTRAGAHYAAGDSILWAPDEVLAGKLAAPDETGGMRTLTWDSVQAGVGWSYLGWIAADRAAGRIALVGLMLDATWEAPDGSVTPLDGTVDAFVQEVYLEAEALPLFTRLVRHVDKDAASLYVSAMRGQVEYYTRHAAAYCKATKRLYNLFRLTDELEAAAYLRELFDEPGAGLYQVDGLLEAVYYAHDPTSGIDRATVVKQLDHVRQVVAAATDGAEERELLAALRLLRDRVRPEMDAGADWDAELRAVQRKCRALVNEYFRARLLGLPRIAAYLAQVGSASAAGP